MTYRIRLVMVDGGGAPVGALPFFEVDEPWWPEVGAITTIARDRFDADLYVLRMVDVAEPGMVPFETVTYTAEAIGELPPLDPPPQGLPYADEPRRAAWARPGGIASITAWADAALAEMGTPRVGPVAQVKTWNLSTILRLPVTGGAVWCKTVPPFFAHEADVVRLVAGTHPTVVPHVLAADPRTATTLFADLGNNVQWDAPESTLVQMVHRFVAVQADWAARTDDLLAIGVPDHRTARIATELRAMIARPDVRETLDVTQLPELDRLAAELPDRFGELVACGIPETFVHGDFWPGNWIEHEGNLVLVDWGDSCVGHPMFDTAPLLGSVEHASIRQGLRQAWVDAWRSAAPESDPERAMAVIPPLAALRQALVYRMFLDRIEPSEHRCHAQDVPDWLRKAIALARRGSGW